MRPRAAQINFASINLSTVEWVQKECDGDETERGSDGLCAAPKMNFLCCKVFKRLRCRSVMESLNFRLLPTTKDTDALNSAGKENIY